MPDHRQSAPTYLATTIGGVRGVIDASVPTVAFVSVNAFAGLTTGIVVAIGTSVLLVALRAVRREPMQQALSGLFGVVIAAIVASRMHRASGFFLPGIAKNGAYLGVGLLSLVIRRPLAGYVLAAFDRRYRGWREHPPLRRAAWWATMIWVALFATRVVVQGALYLANLPGWLAVANIALGLPLFGVAILATIATVQRMAPGSVPDDDPDAGPGDESLDGTGVDQTTGGLIAEARPPSKAPS